MYDTRTPPPARSGHGALAYRVRAVLQEASKVGVEVHDVARALLYARQRLFRRSRTRVYQ
jgi:hypothetical protein